MVLLHDLINNHRLSDTKDEVMWYLILKLKLKKKNKGRESYYGKAQKIYS